MTKTIRLQLLSILCLLFLISGKQTGHKDIESPKIVAGIAKLTGTIISPNEIDKRNVSVEIVLPHPITGEYAKYKAAMDQSGKFSIDVNVETDITLVGLNTSVNPEKYLLVKLTSGSTTNIDIAYNANDNDIKTLAISPAMPQNDMIHAFAVRDEMIQYQPDRGPQALYDKSTDYLMDVAKKGIAERLDILKNDTFLSTDVKELLSKDYHLIFYGSYVIDYEREMIRNYQNMNRDSNTKPEIHKIDKTYYRFLKDFKLNDPQYLQVFEFLEFQKKMLQNEVLNLPEIGESDIPTWLASVKGILADVIGFNDGQYYDVLVANAYSRQLNEEARPLSEKQKANIAGYWGKGEIAKILLRKNLQVVALDKGKTPAVVNDIASVAPDKVIETILAKYRNKVVFVDFWATWCGPCLNAMQDFRTAKNDFHDKNVVFVYLTNGSSPKKLWEEKIKGIGSEHYYLTAAQWEYVMNKFNFEGIPSYLLYNKEGQLKNNFTGFPGIEEVKGMINGLL